MCMIHVSFAAGALALRGRFIIGVGGFSFLVSPFREKGLPSGCNTTYTNLVFL